MGLQINTNVTALNALRNLTNVNSAVSASTERLSSGLRINRASDDPAGLIISESLRAQIDGLNQAISNSQDASNVIKTADGGLSQVNSLLRNIRQLAVHAANTGVNDNVAVQADQAQITSAVSSIDRIATQTQFGTKHLLDGSSGTSASVVATTLANGLYLGTSFGGGTTVSGNITISAVTAATRAANTGGTVYAAGLSANITVASTIIINGQTINATTSDTVQTLINKFNNLTATTGVTASLNATNHIVLNTQDYGSNAQLNVSESAATIGVGATTAGTNAVATVSAQALVNGVTTTLNVTFNGGVGAHDSGLHLTDTSGNSLDLTELGNVNGAAATQIGIVSSSAVQFQIGANANQTVQVSLGNIRAANLGTTAVGGGLNLSNLDVTTAAGANNAILIADQAITQVSQLRSSLGAFQNNTLNSTISYLGVGSENLSASESQIRDTNVASEVVNLTKNQIIQQAATSVLAQANSQPQQILKLLQ